VLTRTRPVVRTIAPRGKPASGEVNTNIVLTAATHDGGYGGVDAVNLVDTSLSKISFALFEDCVRADVPEPRPRLRPFYGGFGALFSRSNVSTSYAARHTAWTARVTSETSVTSIQDGSAAVVAASGGGWKWIRVSVYSGGDRSAS